MPRPKNEQLFVTRAEFDKLVELVNQCLEWVKEIGEELNVKQVEVQDDEPKS